MGRGTPAAAGHVRLLSDGDLEQLDEAALHVLATVGVSVPSTAARAAAAAAGAAADGVRVTFPPDVIRLLVAEAPARITLGSRARSPLITGERPLVTTDGCPAAIYDLDTDEQRATTAADVAAIARLVDGLDEIDFCWPAVSALDRPAERRGLCELYEALANTGKHVQTVTIVDPEQARLAVAIARLLAGGEERLRAEPPVSALLGTVGPLGHDADTLEAGLVFAEAGLPVGFVTMPMGGSTAPITMAGSLVMAIAEALSGVAVIQAAHPGAPVFISFIPTVMDLKTGDFTGGAPEDTLMAAAVADVGRFYGLPTQGGVNASGAKLPGWQSAVDDVTTSLLAFSCGVDLLAGVGMVAGGRVFSFAETVLGAWVAALARGLTAVFGDGVSGGGPAAETATTGPPPGSDWETWAGDRARAVLETHEPPPLSPELDAAIKGLIGA